jgi:hypothetical protein
MNELMHNQKLLDLAREINLREETIAAIRGQVEERLKLAGPEIILQGQALLAARSQMKHGYWLDWLKTHCPGVSARNADRYMLRARRADELLSSSKEFHLLCDEEETQEPKPTEERWGDDLEGINRTARLVNYLCERNSPSKWPSPARHRAWELLEPLVRELKPELFPAGAAAA